MTEDRQHSGDERLTIIEMQYVLEAIVTEIQRSTTKLRKYSLAEAFQLVMGYVYAYIAASLCQLEVDNTATWIEVNNLCRKMNPKKEDSD